jgi:hypothetical protein
LLNRLPRQIGHQGIDTDVGVPGGDDDVVDLVVGTGATARCSSQYRSRSTSPYASSAVTQASRYNSYDSRSIIARQTGSHRC